MGYRNIDFTRCTYHVGESYKTNKFGLPKAGRLCQVDLPRFLVDDLTSYCRNLKKESLKQGRADRSAFYRSNDEPPRVLQSEEISDAGQAGVQISRVNTSQSPRPTAHVRDPATYGPSVARLRAASARSQLDLNHYGHLLSLDSGAGQGRSGRRIERWHNRYCTKSWRKFPYLPI